LTSQLRTACFPAPVVSSSLSHCPEADVRRLRLLTAGPNPTLEADLPGVSKGPKSPAVGADEIRIDLPALGLNEGFVAPPWPAEFAVEQVSERRRVALG
jgi:hypothetical protein